MRTFNLSHVDTCHPDYLVDHHNREGEALFGVYLGTMPEDAAETLLEDISQDDRVPEWVSCSDLEAEAREECKGVDWRRIDPKTGDPTDDEQEDEDEEQPQAWFLLTWSES